MPMFSRDGSRSLTQAPMEPTVTGWPQALHILWIGARLLWLLGDVGIIVLYVIRRQISDAQESVLLLTFMWTAPLGTLAMILSEFSTPRLGFSLMGYTLTGPGETALDWFVASLAANIQYFVIVPRILRGYARQVPASIRERLLISVRVILISGLGWTVFLGLRAALVALGAGPFARYAELQRRHGRMPRVTIVIFERLHHAAHRLESLALWPIVLCLMAILYVWLVRRPRIWHFPVLVLPAAHIARDADDLGVWQYSCAYWVFLALLAALLRRYHDRGKGSFAKRDDPPSPLSGTVT
jgi:hypothetical protein